MSNMQEDANKPGYTPGWNDPPTFQYNTHVEQKTNVLNKRVAFPLSKPPSGQTSAVSSDGGILPTVLSAPPGASGFIPKVSTPVNLPAPPPHNNIVTPGEKSTSVLTEFTKIDSDKLPEVIIVFNKQLENDKIISKAGELRKRITVMENAWKEGKLSDTVKERLINISAAITAGDFEAAEVICRSLVVDYNSEVNAWVVAIRQIIQTSK